MLFFYLNGTICHIANKAKWMFKKRYMYDGYTRLCEFDDGRGFDNYFDSARSKNYQKCYFIWAK